MSVGAGARLAELGLRLPATSPPKGAYIPAVRSGDLVHVAGQIPLVDGELIATGAVGTDITPERAADLSRRCALAALAAVDAVAGLDAVRRVVKVVGYVASADGFGDQLAVVSGATELFIAIFGGAGRPVCTAVGVAQLPLHAPVEIEVTVEISTGASADQS
ncbi:RidA family protein [Nocardia sp. NPDC050710]|uniref:RidA family protein n=1 Tax=Nocardia sp. NPDC050710 TaxID=3157220 RepID=UPI003406BF84